MLKLETLIIRLWECVKTFHSSVDILFCELTMRTVQWQVMPNPELKSSAWLHNFQELHKDKKVINSFSQHLISVNFVRVICHKLAVLERVRTRTRTQWVSPSPSPDSSPDLDSTLVDSDSDSDSTSVDSDSSAVDSDSGLMDSDSDSDSTQLDSDSQWVQMSPVRKVQGKFRLSCAINHTK